MKTDKTLKDWNASATCPKCGHTHGSVGGEIVNFRKRRKGLLFHCTQCVDRHDFTILALLVAKASAFAGYLLAEGIV